MNSNRENSESPFFLLHHKLLEQFEKFPEKTIVEYYFNGNYKAYSYKDICQLVFSFADSLAEIRDRGRHIAIISENRPEWICAYFAVLLTGLVNVPIDPQLADPEIAAILKDAEVKILFTSIKHCARMENLKSLAPSLDKILIVDEIQPASFYPQQKIGIVEDLDATASLLYTSGTTAIPKGVMLSHRNFSSNYNSIKKLGIVTANDIILSILPFHHSYPFMASLLYPLLCGTKIIMAQILTGEELMQIITQKGVTILVGVPQLFKIMNDKIQSELKRIPYILRVALTPFIRKKSRRKIGKQFRFFLSGGAKLNEKAAKDLFHLGLPIIEGYGLTETSPVVTINSLRKPKIGSAGKPIPGVEIMINQPNRDGVGEILIKGPNVMKGYYKKEEETKEIMENGWFHSGDLGYIDKEGYLYITGRIKEVIVLSSGKNIYPEELESFYAQIPFIKEICIIGKPERDNPKISESLWAVIVPDLDFFAKVRNVNIHETLSWELKAAVEKQPPYRRIGGFTIAREELPHTRLGKIKRYEAESRYKEIVIKQMAKTATPAEIMPEDEKLAESGPGKEIIKAVSKQLKLKRKISVNDHLELDLGIDSLGRIELLFALEAVLNIKLPEQTMAESFTIKDLIIKIQNYIKAPKEEPISTEIPNWNEIIIKPPSRDLTRKIYLNLGIKNYLLTFFIVKTLYILYKIIWSLKVYGRRNIPKIHPYIICSNHQSFLDGPIIVSTIPFTAAINLYFLGYRYYFDMPLLRKLVRLLKIIPLDPAVNLIDALRASVYVLGKGKSVCIFPEGARTPNGKIQEFKKGIGILTKHIAVPIVPVYMNGSFQSWPLTRTLPRPYPLIIRYGKPVMAEDLVKIGYQLGAEDDYTAIAMGLRDKIEKLSNI